MRRLPASICTCLLVLLVMVAPVLSAKPAAARSAAPQASQPDSLQRVTSANLALAPLLAHAGTSSASVSAPGAAAPFAPAGAFATSFWPRGHVLFSQAGHPFLFGTEVYRAETDFLWHTVTDPMPYAPKTTFAISPNFAQDNFLALGTDYGTDALRLSVDGGYHWDSPEEPVTGPINAIGFSPAFASDQTLFAVRLHHSQIIKSTDGGQHWAPVANPPRNSAVLQLMISPYYHVDQTLVARLSDGTLWRSPNGGQSWVRADVGLGTEAGNPALSAGLLPLGQGVVALFAATEEAAVFSLNWGQQWYLVDFRKFVAIAVPPDFLQSLTVYGIEPFSGRLLVSRDLGDSWSEPLPGQLVDWVTFSPGYWQDQTVYAGGPLGMWRSTNAGHTWSLVSGQPVPWLTSLLQLEVSPDFDQDGTLVAVAFTEGLGHHLLRSTDAGRSWSSSLLPGAGNPDPVVALSPAFSTDHKLFLARDTHLYVSSSLGNSWSEVTGALPFAPSLIRFSPAYATDQTLFIGNRVGGGVYRSSTGGTAWTKITEGLLGDVTDLDVSPGYPGDGTLYVTFYQAGVYRTDNGGSDWTPVPGPAYYTDFRVALSPDFPQDRTLVLGASAGGVFRSENGGDDWIDLTDDQIYDRIMDVTLSPRGPDDQTILITPYNGPVFLSEDAGGSWFPLQGVPWVGGFGLHYRLALTYKDGRLLPLATTPTALYLYEWMQLPPLPPLITTGLMTGTTGVVSFTVDLEPPAYPVTALPWVAEENGAWLNVTPLSGTLPAELTLEVDAGMIGGTTSANLTLQRHLSLRQVETTPIEVRAFWITDQVWLPSVRRGGAAASSSLEPAAATGSTLFALPADRVFVWHEPRSGP